MLFTERNQLTVIELEKDEESVFIETVKRALEESHSNTIYYEEASGGFVGIISTGDVFRAHGNGWDRVRINREFAFVYAGEYLKAKKIFAEKEYISTIPVLTKENNLLGEYMRWDETLILDYELSAIRKGRIFCFHGEDKIALVRPKGHSVIRHRIYRKMQSYLESQYISAACIDDSEVISYADKVDMLLFVEENEIRACGTLFKMIWGNHNAAYDKMKTFFNCRVNAESYLYDQCSDYLKEIYEKGVSIVAMTLDSVSPYYESLIKKNQDKFAMMGEAYSYILPESMYQGFFDDLYSADYADAIMHLPVGIEYHGGMLSLRDCHSQYYNVTNGERTTTGQPDDYERSIYFTGPCYIYGHDVEDCYTIESILQKRLCEKGKAVRCVNYGAMGMYIGYNCIPRIAAIPLKRGDIVVIDRPADGIEGIKYLEISSIIENNEVKAEWMVDNPMHCNHKINEVYADTIYEAIEPVLDEKTVRQGELIEKEENYIKLLYLDRFFTDYDFSQYHRTGAIVMNCNPFTNGHRYLTEQALRYVDFLIIFVVEEDKSDFSFTERLSMVKEGVADLENVLVVPGGPFILSQLSFPEYFLKEASEDLVRHTEQDITTFAEKIAPQLGIKYRFVGEEPEDEVTNQYNTAMKKILPQYGIELIEIPRKTFCGKPVSASLVRKYIENSDIERLSELVPDTTRTFLGMI